MVAMPEKVSEERTFKEYSAAQAKAYASGRDTWNEKIFQKVLDHHKATGGYSGVLVDVGCGPGNSTRPLARHFDNAYGIDPSPEMINTARQLGAEVEGGETAEHGRIEYEVGRAELMTTLRESGRKADLLTSAMAVGTMDATAAIVVLI